MLTSTPGIISSRRRDTNEYEALASISGQFPIKGVSSCFASIPVSTDLDTYDNYYQLGGSYNTGIGQSFTVGKGHSLNGVYVNLRKIGSPTGTVTCRIYYASGIIGSSAVPGNLLAEFGTKSASLITAYDPSIDSDDYNPVALLSVDGISPVWLQPSVPYVMTIEYSGGDASNYIQAAINTALIETNTNAVSKTTGSWSASTSASLCMFLCAEELILDFTSIAYNFNNVTNFRTIGAGGVQKVGISFTTSGIQILSKIDVFMKTVGSAANTTGYFYVQLYASASNQPTGTVLDTSDNVYVNSIRSVYDQCVFNFTSGLILPSGTTYTLVISYAGGTVSTDISIGIGQDTTTSSYTGNSFYQNIGSGTWTNESSTIDNCFILGLYSYTETAFETYDATANGDQFNYIAATQNTKIAQSFTGVNGLFSKVTVSLRATGSPTGNITASLFADDGGTFGTTGKPTGTALATSGTIAASTIASGAEAPYSFTFSGANLYYMTAGTIYWIAIEYSSGSSSNKIGVVMDISSGTAPGRAAYYNGTIWAFTTYDNTGTSGASDEMCYVLYSLT
jgi:hypothetical protein